MSIEKQYPDKKKIIQQGIHRIQPARLEGVVKNRGTKAIRKQKKGS